MSRLKLFIVVTLGWHATLVVPSPEVRRTSQLSELSNLQVYNNTLYVGGLDRLYSFDEDLNVLQSADTCTGPCKSNYNKVLLLNETGQTLMTCGTGNGGICERRLLANLSYVAHSSSSGDNTNVDTLAVSTDRNRLAVALMWNMHLFFIAVTYGENVRNVSIRYGIWENIFSHAYNALTLRRTLFDINEVGNYEGNSKLRLQTSPGSLSSLNDFVVYYKYAFQYQLYTFLLTNQKTYVGDDTFVSKVARLCNYDPTFKTYVDMELGCEADGIKYNLVQDATVAQFNGTDYLIASFGKSSDPEVVIGAGVLCAISMTNLNSDLSQAKLEFVNGYPFNLLKRYLEINIYSNFVRKTSL